MIAIDPGTTHSAWVHLVDGQLYGHNEAEANDELLQVIAELGTRDHLVVIEQIEAMGMIVGREIFETVHWAGRFHQLALVYGLEVAFVTRRQVKLYLCGSMQAKDPNIRAALLDRYGGAGAKGTKRAPGPLFGISGDAWSALAVGVTYAAKHGSV